MEKFEVVEVHTTIHSAEVNEFLKKNWVLLDTAPGKHDDGQAYFLYSLGYPKHEQEHQALLSSSI